MSSDNYLESSGTSARTPVPDRHIITADELRAKLGHIAIAPASHTVGRKNAAGYTYQSKQHAAEVLAAVELWDRAGRKPKRLMAADVGWTFSKLRNYLFSARKYIIEQMADNAEAQRLIGAVHFRQIPGGGYEFRESTANMALAPGMSLAAALTDVTTDSDSIRSQLLDWLAEPHELREKFERPLPDAPALNLSAEDQQWFRDRFAEVRDQYIAAVTADKIVFIRYSAEQQPAKDANQEP